MDEDVKTHDFSDFQYMLWGLAESRFVEATQLKMQLFEYVQMSSQMWSWVMVKGYGLITRTDKGMFCGNEG